MGLDVTGKFRYPPPDEAWLSQHREDPIDPEIPLIDPHHHVWEEAGHPYLMEDLYADVRSGHNVVATVMVQAGFAYRQEGPDHLRPVGETERVVALATEADSRHPDVHLCAAIVGFADLTLGDRLTETLDAHEQAAHGRLRGIRHSVGYDSHFPDGIVLRPPKRYLLADPDYRAGVGQLVKRGLSFETMLYHQQIGELADMARAFPDLPIVLDHYGAPIGVGHYRGRDEERFGDWRASMAELAQCPNVTVKLGGLGMIITGAEWHERPKPPTSEELADAWRPWFDTTVDLFGADRCMFEGNFPVDKAMFDYVTMWNAYKRLAAGASDSEKAALFRNTAARFYRIESVLSES